MTARLKWGEYRGIIGCLQVSGWQRRRGSWTVGTYRRLETPEAVAVRALERHGGNLEDAIRDIGHLARVGREVARELAQKTHRAHHWVTEDDTRRLHEAKLILQSMRHRRAR